jgi:hypothetical protein
MHDNGGEHMMNRDAWKPEEIARLLKESEPEQWLDSLVDLATLESVPGSYLDEFADDRFDDALWRLRWDEEWLYVYVVRDHDEASPAELMAARVVQSVERIRSSAPGLRSVRLAGIIPFVLCRRSSGFGEPLTVSQLLESVLDTPSELDDLFSSVLNSEALPEDLAAARRTSCLLLGLEPGAPDTELDVRFAALALQKIALDNVGLIEAFDLFIEDRIKPRFPTADFDEIWCRQRDALLSELQGGQHQG